MYKIEIVFNKENRDYNIDLDKRYSKEEAIIVVKEIRSQGGNAELFPKEYS